MHVEVSYEYIGLSKNGNEFIENISEAEYRSYLNTWKTLLNNYLKVKITYSVLEKYVL